MSKQVFRLSLKSTYEESEKVPDFVSDIQKESQLNEDTTGSLMLLLSEAVTNAIVHGNRLDEKKPVDVCVEVNEEAVISTVKDRGSGFDPHEANDPLKEENLLKESGRGVFLIKEISDEVEYLENGTKIRFILNR
ncbi:MAG: ATP-binding protein [Bacteroidetes bacterium]|jgi:serine/threonine-protein kinase RsbW|nr:ATP-binding protein [Bacteroidota bacterium]